MFTRVRLVQVPAEIRASMNPVQRLARLTHGHTGASLQELVRQALTHAVDRLQLSNLDQCTDAPAVRSFGMHQDRLAIKACGPAIARARHTRPDTKMEPLTSTMICELDLLCALFKVWILWVNTRWTLISAPFLLTLFVCMDQNR